MTHAEIKKDLQKVVKTIRDERNAAKGTDSSFPKAMMTGQQMELGTATVNCGGEWATRESSEERATAVITDPRFQAFLAKSSAEAHLELNSFGTIQVRIRY